jgi:AraC-like DNA-binding protein
MQSDHNDNANFLRIYYCGQEQCAPRHSWGPAIRPHYLLHVVLKGRGFFQYNNQKWTLKAGDAFLIEPMKTHFYQADEKDPWAYAWVGFDGAAVDEILSHTVLHNFPVFVSSSERACQPITEMVQAFAKTDRNQLELSALLLSLFSGMITQSTRNIVSYDEHYYQTALEYIKNNFTYDLKIQEIADYIGIDRTYLYKIFIREAKISPKQYLLQYRIRAASKLLQSQKYTVTETAYSCGFRDAAAFCSHFRQQVGMTPKKYKEMIGSGDY